MSSTNPPPLRRVSLPPLHEFRFELEPKEAIAITLLQGTAEVFGCELVPGQPHPFGDEVRAAVWTSEGAELEMSPFAEIDPHVPKGGEDRGGSVLYREVGNAFLLEGRSSVKATDRLEQLATSLCNVIPSLLPARWWRVKGGRLETSYESSESPLPSYLSLHLALARLRLLARPSTFASNPNADLSLPDDEVPGPRMMLVGERGAGKTTLVKTLVNWRTREIWAKAGGRGGAANGGGVVVVNLDVGEGGCTMPGTMSLVSINSLLPTTTPVSSLGTATSSGPPVPFPAPTSSDWHPSSSIDAYAPPVNPLVFWHGHTSPNEHGPVYEQLLKRVGKALKRKLDEGGVEGWKAGCVVDTPGEWAEKKAMGNVSKAVRALEINIVLVVGNERLEGQVRKLLETNKTVTVVRVPASQGAAEDDSAYHGRVKDAQIRSYFYGGPAFTQGVLSPFSIIVKFEDLKIVSVGEAADTVVPDSALPLGAGRIVGDTDLVPLDLTASRTPSELVNKILAIPQAGDEDSDEDRGMGPVLGWVFVSAIDQNKKKVTLLSPLPGRLPRKTLILGSLDWQDS